MRGSSFKRKHRLPDLGDKIPGELHSVFNEGNMPQMPFIVSRYMELMVKVVELIQELTITRAVFPERLLVLFHFFRQLLPIPQRASRIAPLDTAGEIVPMVEQTQAQVRMLADIQFVE